MSAAVGRCLVEVDLNSYDLELARPVIDTYGFRVKPGRTMWLVDGTLEYDEVAEFTQALDDCFEWPKLCPTVRVLP